MSGDIPPLSLYAFVAWTGHLYLHVVYNFFKLMHSIFGTLFSDASTTGFGAVSF